MSNQRFTIQLDAKMNVDQVKTAVQNMQNELGKLKLPQNVGSQLQGTFSKLSTEIEKFQSLSANGIGSTKDFNQLASSGNKILQIYNQLTIQVKNLGGLSDGQIQKLFPPEIQANIEKANKAMADYGQASKTSQKNIKDLESEITKAQKETERLVKDKEKLEGKKTVSDSTIKQYGKDADEAKAKFEKAQQELVELQTKASGYKTGRKAKGYVDLVDNQIPQKEAEIAKLEQAWERLKTKKEKALTQTQKDEALAKLTQDITAAQGNVTQLQNKLANLKAGNPQSFNQLVSQLNQIKGINLDPATATMETVSQAVSNLSSNEMERLKQAFVQSGQVVDGAKGSFDRFGLEIDETRGKVSQLDDKMSQINMLKSRIQYFFGLTNSIMLFRRAITSALNTVKELDATMTEAAVVTKFDVSDMWNQLPTYSKHAQDLGISINGMYQATTLYYQQGLKTNEAMQLGVETMKMAKIAGMDSAQATEAMTAALRGFNMELNEASATRVNDVYSQLAAVTASNTEQIATAMEKTASIAASANMEFETTAALLAQIIETTQEAPETAGTAMKTIVARFAEVKSLRDKGLTSGEDEEGEVIDVNKIQTALRSVGISMEGFFSGTEGLDSVLLKLAEKWSGLDFETQRYIATMAAGSRQQSRFIAMMSDYGRTTELVGQAQNSAGASQKQFEKTQKSLVTSLNRLKNAWDQFQMGLANNEILKAGIDVLTKFLETVNKITDGISGGNGLIKSVVSLGVTIAGLKGAGAILNGVMASMGSAATGTGLNLGVNLKNSFKQGFGKKAAVPKVNFDAAQTKAYDSSLKQLNATMRQTEALESKSKLTKKEKNALTALEKQQTEQLAVATGQLAAATDLNNDQAREAVLMSAQGISLDTAVIASKAGVTAAEIQEALGTKLVTEATEEEIVATIHEIAAKKGQYIAINAGILGRIEEIAMTKLGIASTLAKVAADKLETMGLKAKTAAMIASLGIIGLIIAAVGALIALIVYLYKTAKANSLEGRMQAAAEATERAKEAAEGAKQAYDDLLSAKSGYDELQNKLEDLTKGTLEWKQALADSNAQVLELLDKYPELAKYLTRGEHGELEITEAGWDYVTEQQVQAVSNANSAVIASQMDETKLKQEKAIKTAAEDGIEYKKGSQWITGDQAVKDIYARYKEEGADKLFKLESNNGYSQALIDLADELEIGEDKLYAMKDALAQYDQALINNEATLQAQSEALVSSQIFGETADYKYSKELVAGMAAGLKGNIDKLTTEIAKTEAAKKGGFQAYQVYQAMSKLNEDTQRDYAVLMSKDVSNATGGFIKEFSEVSPKELKKMATDLDFKTTDDMAKAFGYNTEAEMKAGFEKVAQYAESEFKKVIETATKYDIQLGKDYIEKMTVAQQQSYVNLLTYAKRLGMDESIQSGIDAIFNIADDEQDEKIRAFMGTLDWSQEGAGEEFLEFLKTLGLDIETIIPNAKKFAENLKIVNAEFSKFDASSFMEQISGKVKKIKGIASNKSLTNEQFLEYSKKGLIKNTSDWKWNGETWVAKTKKTMENLIDALIDNTKAQVEAKKAELKAKIKSYNETKDKILRGDNEFVQTTTATGKTVIVSKEKYEKNKGFYSPFTAQTLSGPMTSNAIMKELEGGKADESVWSVFFSSLEAYQQWVLTGAQGIQQLINEYNALDTFEFPKITTTGGGGSKWENPFDKLYNNYEEVNKLLRQREQIERRYDKILNSRNASYKDIIKYTKEELANLKNQRKEQEKIKAGKADEIQDLLKSKKGKKYDQYFDYDEKTGEINIAWSKVNKLKGKKGEGFEEFVSQLEGLRDQWQEAQDELDSIEDSVDEIRERGKDEYFDTEDQIKEALIKERQDEIDKLSEINDSINDTNSKLLESMQEQIDEYRQNRDNQKTEEEIADKQRRLAYLQQDTSGANATEILNLQKEIDEAQEDYTDTLIDQKISELQKQNDQAAEQRQRQIEIMEAQLQHYEESGVVWQDVYDVMNDSANFDKNGALKPDGPLAKLLQNAADYTGMSKLGKEEWTNNLVTQIAAAFGYIKNGRRAEKGQSVTFTTKDNKELTGSADKDGNIKAGGHTYTGVHQNEQGDWVTDENYTSGKSQPEETDDRPKWDSNYTKPWEVKDTIKSGSSKKAVSGLQWALNKLGYRTGNIDGIYGKNTTNAVTKFQNKQGWNPTGKAGPKTKEALSKLFQYKEGGLADFTGPAWLDGTKSKPEYILNADQTKAFFSLVDVLGSLQSGDSKASQNNGDTSFDIDINVESIGNDYDVEQLANKVKSLINEDARYRNNNAINLMR